MSIAVAVKNLPYIIAGPLLRRVTPNEFVLWLVTRESLKGRFQLWQSDDLIVDQCLESLCQSVEVGKHAHIHLLHLKAETPLPVETLLEYDLICEVDDCEVDDSKLSRSHKNLAELLPHLLYEGESRPSFVIKTLLDKVLHGSCRKPHFNSDDALLNVDHLLKKSPSAAERPALLVMSGDQIYADDVAGPMLVAIHQVIALLQLAPEVISGAVVNNSDELYSSELCYYQRELLLPQTKTNEVLKDRFFGGAKKPIFTADGAHNHLITLSEVLAMYFLVWSPQLWPLLNLDKTDLDGRFAERYNRERQAIENFAESLSGIHRALAHLPVYMIFDDHDVTDDWNLTRGWEEAAYSHPFSRRIIGNALVGYWLCQGWGNAPRRFPKDWTDKLEASDTLSTNQQRDSLIDELLEFDRWNYHINTSPKLVVMDTRTQRWWSESSAAKPSGLIDWEMLSELQQELLGEKSVLLVSPAPIFGMKLVEVVQRIFTYFGHALTVDAENWMAHRGAASVILNIFRHRKTPANFVILSGDVHYSFVYDIKLRFKRNTPNIWQITCSGFKNEFPHKLLRAFDRTNRWLYGSNSPLNWFTKRRRMQIRSRIPQGLPQQRVYNGCALGVVELDEQGVPIKIGVIDTQGQETLFPPRK